jgi:peptidyl-prolyl cis-trans isomerase C
VRKIDCLEPLRYATSMTTAAGWMRIVLALVITVVAGCDRGTPPGADRSTSPSEPAGASAKAPAEAKVIATFANQQLTDVDVQEALARLPAPSRAYLTAPDRKRQFVENLILNDLLFTEGQKAGYDRDPEIERQVNELRKRLVVQRVMRQYQEPPVITDEQVRAYYDENPTLYSTTQVRASHILLKDRQTADEVAAEAKAHPEKFADLAREKSIDGSTAPKGGDLGTFGQGRMVPEFERVAFELKVGQVSDPVKTPYGYHVIMVTERKEGERRPFEQVKEQIRGVLRTKAQQERIQSYYDSLKSGANVQIDEEALASVTPPAPSREMPASPHPMPPGH